MVLPIILKEISAINAKTNDSCINGTGNTNSCESGSNLRNSCRNGKNNSKNSCLSGTK